MSPVIACQAVLTDIESVEARLLVGLQFPNGRAHDPSRAEADNRFAIPKIIAAYQALKELGVIDGELMARLHLLARIIVFLHWFDYEKLTIPEDQRALIEQIAEEGRAVGRAEQQSEAEKLEQQRIFCFDDTPFAVQIPHRAIGCSASTCSNCGEPVAFSAHECPSCQLSFIGPFTPWIYPLHIDRNDWDSMAPSARLSLATSIYHKERDEGRPLRINFI